MMYLLRDTFRFIDYRLPIIFLSSPEQNFDLRVIEHFSFEAKKKKKKKTKRATEHSILFEPHLFCTTLVKRRDINVSNYFLIHTILIIACILLVSPSSVFIFLFSPSFSFLSLLSSIVIAISSKSSTSTIFRVPSSRLQMPPFLWYANVKKRNVDEYNSKYLKKIYKPRTY